MKSILYKSFKPLILLLFIVNISSAQVYKEGNLIIDAYYGFPNLMFYKWNSFTSTYSNYSNAKNVSIGPVGGRIEYMLTERIGVGLNGSYSHTAINYLFDDMNGAGPLPYSVVINRFRIMPRFNFHIGKSSKFDPYVAGGIGYYNRTVVFSPLNPANGYADPNTGDPFGPDWPFEPLLIPVALEAKFGMRYFFTDRIGFGAEVGFGGPLATFGLTAKF
jgi:hypothetical protein